MEVCARAQVSSVGFYSQKIGLIAKAAHIAFLVGGLGLEEVFYEHSSFPSASYHSTNAPSSLIYYQGDDHWDRWMKQFYRDIGLG
jgi:hypothetical protein